MKKRQLSEAEAWREVARRAACARSFRWGLCCAIADLRNEGRIDDKTYGRMNRRVDWHMTRLEAWGMAEGRARGTNLFMDEPGNRGPRVLAALLLALEAEEEL